MPEVEEANNALIWPNDWRLVEKSGGRRIKSNTNLMALAFCRMKSVDLSTKKSNIVSSGKRATNHNVMLKFKT